MEPDSYLLKQLVEAQLHWYSKDNSKYSFFIYAFLFQDSVKDEEDISEQVVAGNVHASNVCSSHETPTLNWWAGSYLRICSRHWPAVAPLSKTMITPLSIM